MSVVTQTRPLRATLYALAAVLPILFGIVIWQLWGLNPETYCNIVQAQGIPAGDHCFKLLMEGLKIKGWVIWLLIGMMASFVLIALVAAVKTVVSIVGPGGLKLAIGVKAEDSENAE